jgi:hypothetical protein
MNDLEISKIRKANELHNTLAQTTVESIYEIGTILHDLKGNKGHGTWSTYVNDNFEFSLRTAQNYMKGWQFIEDQKRNGFVYEQIAGVCQSPTDLYELASKGKGEVLDHFRACIETETPFEMPKTKKKPKIKNVTPTESNTDTHNASPSSGSDTSPDPDTPSTADETVMDDAGSGSLPSVSTGSDSASLFPEEDPFTEVDCQVQHLYRNINTLEVDNADDEARLFALTKSLVKIVVDLVNRFDDDQKEALFSSFSLDISSTRIKNSNLDTRLEKEKEEALEVNEKVSELFEYFAKALREYSPKTKVPTKTVTIMKWHEWLGKLLMREDGDDTDIKRVIDHLAKGEGFYYQHCITPEKLYKMYDKAFNEMKKHRSESETMNERTIRRIREGGENGTS